MNIEYFEHIMFIFCLVAVVVFMWLFFLRLWRDAIRWIQRHTWKMQKKRAKKKKSHKITITADYEWLKPMCKKCPYFIPGGDSKDKDSFMQNGPTRCIRPTGSKCLGKHVIRRKHTFEEALENV